MKYFYTSSYNLSIAINQIEHLCVYFKHEDCFK